MKIAFIGGGNMGEAMLSAILEKGLSEPRSITVSDANEGRRQYLAAKYGVAVTADNLLATRKGEVIILAIKPQNLAEVMAGLSRRLDAGQLVLSIIAGARIDTLSRGLKHYSVVRAMPNMPAQIGLGMTVWTATEKVTPEQKAWASSILGAIGKEISVDDEKYLDMATAVSGSGPAYFFLYVELLVEAAVALGLLRAMAEEMVLQTMLGSGQLIQKSGKSPAELRRMVTSPGGTTAEALAVFEKEGLASLVKQAVQAAYDKAKKLGN